MDVSGEAIELRDDQRGFRLLGGGNGSRELRPIGTFPALDFAVVRDQKRWKGRGSSRLSLPS